MVHPIPKSRNCLCCGVENPISLNMTYYYEENKVFADFILDKRYATSESIAHPGIAAGILIEAMAWAPACVLRHPTVMLEFNLRTLKPVPLDRKMRVIAEAVSANRWISNVQGHIVDEGGEVCFKAKGSFTVADSKAAPVNDHFEFNPGFYLPE